jgi:hypothetical protein
MRKQPRLKAQSSYIIVLTFSQLGQLSVFKVSYNEEVYSLLSKYVGYTFWTFYDKLRFQ